MNAGQSDPQTLWNLIKDIQFGMPTHRHRDGSLQGHPLTTQNKSIDGTARTSHEEFNVT